MGSRPTASQRPQMQCSFGNSRSIFSGRSFIPPVESGSDQTGDDQHGAEQGDQGKGSQGASDYVACYRSQAAACYRSQAAPPAWLSLIFAKRAEPLGYLFYCQAGGAAWVLVVGGGLEPPTPAFSVQCSTD